MLSRTSASLPVIVWTASQTPRPRSRKRAKTR